MPADPYLIPGTTILANKLGIRDAEQLREAEFALTRANALSAMQYADRQRVIGERTWRGIHRRLFGDVYAWAGRYRTTELRKGQDAFAPRRAIAGYADASILPMFRAAAATTENDRTRFISALARCWAELNYLHPFREGNGRATHILVNALAHRHGVDIHWPSIPRDEEIAAAKAGNRQDYAGYAHLLDLALRPWDRASRPEDFWPPRDR
ncbi:Fic family protein [Hyphomicrobium sp. CS1BSMeth3]|uniref:Fic/DOC family protein n=1 Tax=Hyphomicrobium sp. CS1BSMeth3 TaxID=1892844 RepID=UPI0009318C3F|nr:Fic family protein [Hyphomicrobium sp. CS1BSMeth3]